MNLTSKIDHYLRPLLARVLPAKTFVQLYSKNRNKFMNFLQEQTSFQEFNASFEHKFCNMTFRNDLGNAAGFDKDGQLLEFNYNLGAGFAIVGTVLEKPYTGNLYQMGKGKYNAWTPLPNSKSAINSLGLPSIGIDKTLDNIKKFQDVKQPENFPIGLSLMGQVNYSEEEKIQSIINCIKKATTTIDFIELNESCPNVEHKTNDLATLNKKIQQIRDVYNGVLLIKFANLSADEEVFEMLANNKVNAISLTNTQKDYSLLQKKISPKDKKLFDYYTTNFKGGVSGKAIQELSLLQIKKASAILEKNNLSIELVHIGGLDNNKDIKLSRNYAQLRQWYTGLMEAIITKDRTTIYKDMCQV